ncbi:heparinase II/III family protein [Gordonibacter massiliensis (ex Traore et al. 2017)]|uniref:heparinase II/III family protein n=1 Tax=Gordonibacter massiliensis (ex Traore et al. 2017) TaxID=1841863 RepID=UPI001C8C3546|nr:heparinase II/III family protein [Gordonibacter massiliensis (ex Traore et al. 2017)]MBX9034075.1 hypothetical protein [Gordonibacter massiliensis (ex Traore et al. 2017)]
MVIARLRGQRKVTASEAGDRPGLHRDVSILVPETDLAPEYLARFDLESLMSSEFLLLNEYHVVDFSRWHADGASHLWNFNLHYFEYAIALGAAHSRGDARCYPRFKEFVESWIDASPYADGDAWHPYTISLRLVNWLVCVDLFADSLDEDERFRQCIERSMRLQYRHLLANQEKHLMANHYFENLKTLAIFSKLFDEDEAFARVWRDLEGQLDEQILPDGVHFERSLMYHKLVLEGIVRTALVLEQSEGGVPLILLDKMQSMLNAMASLEKGMGKTPFFNDSADGVAKECRQLAAACERLFGLESDDSKTVFPDAGYFKLYDGDIAVMFDAGEPGPDYMLGHAHCDCLSYELSYRGSPVVVNSGTYAYQSELRSYFRSTAAHNTVQVDGEEQMECWGEHRVARRYELDKACCDAARGVAEASIVLPSGKVQKRRIKLIDRELEVLDSAIGGANVQLTSVIHILDSNLVGISLEDVGEKSLTTGFYSSEFGVCGSIPKHVISGNSCTCYSLHFAEEAGD